MRDWPSLQIEPGRQVAVSGPTLALALSAVSLLRVLQGTLSSAGLASSLVVESAPITQGLAKVYLPDVSLPGLCPPPPIHPYTKPFRVRYAFSSVSGTCVEGV